MAFAALGAAELLSVDPGHQAARALLADYADTVAKPNGDAAWPWPESRLTYANAVLPEAMIAAGVALDDSTLRQQGLDLLGWLVEYETAGGHLSPTPAGGAGPDDPRPGVRSAADRGVHPSRCVRPCRRRRPSFDLARRRPRRRGLVHGRQRRATAHVGPPDRRWIRRPARRRGNRNQGAESTLAVLSTLQHARRFSTVRQ